MIRILPWVVCGFLCVGLLGCSALERTSAEEFLRRAEEIDQIHTVKATRFIGATERSAYLEHWNMGLVGSSTTVVWVPLNELPEEVIVAMRAGEQPWCRPGRLEPAQSDDQ